jgi:hypothetical protein
MCVCACVYVCMCVCECVLVCVRDIMYMQMRKQVLNIINNRREN